MCVYIFKNVLNVFFPVQLLLARSDFVIVLLCNNLENPIQPDKPLFKMQSQLKIMARRLVIAHKQHEYSLKH